MALNRFFSASLSALLLSLISLPAAARPQIASGDRLLDTDFEGCLSRVDGFIAGIGVEADKGASDRTGYFKDGTFRLLCYRTGAESVVIVFVAHDTSLDVATQFVELALNELSRSSIAPAQPR